MQDGDTDAQRRHDYLGGDLYAAFSAALNFPLPVETIANAGIRGHAFVDAGGHLTHHWLLMAGVYCRHA